MDSDGFISVKYSKRKPRSIKTKFGAVGVQNSDNIYEPTVNYCKNTALRKISFALNDIQQSSYYESFLEGLKNLVLSELGRSLEEIAQIVCYGLGSLCTTTKSIEQFALLVNLQKKLKAPMEFYDPIFTDADKSIICDHYEYQVLEINEEGRRTVEDLTLFCLPHCPHMLSNNLLLANWSPLNLKNCIIISNGFTKVLDNTRNPKIPPFDYILKAKPITKEQQLVNSFTPIDVFNDISIHVFPTENSELICEDIWDKLQYPREECNAGECGEDEMIRKT